ncbi:MAG: chemotaxis protein CheW [Actinomycetota bacterium]
MTENDFGIRLCTFHLGELYLGIDVREVQEVIQGLEITPVPHADAAVDGLINLRGQIATTIDLRRRFRLEERPDDHNPVHVVVRSAGEWMSLLVDSIGDVLEVSAENYEAPPETVDKLSRDLILGAYKLEDELLLMMNIDVAVTLDSNAKERV